MKNKKKTPYLPSELIIQILLRLPVKFLLRFRCVCKSWFSLISDSHFAKSHFEVSSLTHTHRNRIITISRTSAPPFNIRKPNPNQIRCIDFETSTNHDFVSPNHDFILRQPYYCKIKGSCRGFICLYCYTNLYVWNPATGFHRQIPLSPFASKLNAYHFCHLYGFGYDQSTDDYLVVLLSYDPTLPNRSSHLEFFSLRDNAWNQIEDPHFTYFNAALIVKAESFFNGAFHWVACRNDLLVDVIIVFDLMEKKLLEMPLPDDFDNDPVSYGLWVFGEFLSLWGMDFHNSRVEIWVMKEYKLHSSWTKTLLIPIDRNIICFSPINSTKSGDIIGSSNDGGLVKYNDRGQLLEYQEGRGNVRQVAMYIESLLSLPVDLEQVYEDDTNKKNQVLKYSHSPFS